MEKLKCGYVLLSKEDQDLIIKMIEDIESKSEWHIKKDKMSRSLEQVYCNLIKKIVTGNLEE